MKALTSLCADPRLNRTTQEKMSLWKNLFKKKTINIVRSEGAFLTVLIQQRREREEALFMGYA